MKRIAMGALALMLTASAVSAGGEIASNQRLPVSPDRYDGAFIDRETAITGCMELVEEIRTSGGEVPDFFARQREYFRDLKRQLQKEKFPNGQELMMGAAIKVCMREKGWVNTCVSSTGRDGDLQTLETARAPSCWANKQHAEPKQAPPEPQIAERQPPVTQPSPAIIERQQLPVIIERQPPVIAEAERQPPVIIPPNRPEMPLPTMSPADMQQYQEDLAIVSQPVTIVGDHENGQKEARLASCLSYWESLHYNRPPQVRQVLYAVRVWRCMFRTHYTIMPSRCPNTASAAVTGWGDGSRGTAISGTRNPYCYARFA